MARVTDIFRPCAALVLAVCTLFGSEARAGAWPREKGSGFVTAATQVSGPGWAGPYSIYSTTYFEYGLGRRMTAGFDIGHGISGQYKAIVFLRKSLNETARGFHYAGEIGIGSIAGELTLRPGLSFGRGLKTGKGTGWISVETYAEFRLKSGRSDLKADFTLGFNHGDRVKTILQLQSGVSQGDPSFLRAAPSVVMRLGRKAHVELGLTQKLIGGDNLGIKLGLWRKF